MRRYLKIPLPKICYTYPTIVKLAKLTLYLGKTKTIYKSCDIPFKFSWHPHFSPNNCNFCYIKKYIPKLYFNSFFRILLSFIESSKVPLINMIAILMMSAKFTTPGLLKIKVFWNQDYHVMNSVFPWRHQQNIVKWPKWYCRYDHASLVTLPFPYEKLSQIQFYDNQKNRFFWGLVLLLVQ